MNQWSWNSLYMYIEYQGQRKVVAHLHEARVKAKTWIIFFYMIIIHIPSKQESPYNIDETKLTLQHYHIVAEPAASFCGWSKGVKSNHSKMSTFKNLIPKLIFRYFSKISIFNLILVHLRFFWRGVVGGWARWDKIWTIF